MRQYVSLVSVVCGTAAATFLATAILIAPSIVDAQESKRGPAATCSCPSNDPSDVTRPPARPRFADARPQSAPFVSGPVAALEAMQLALTEVEDGSSYVWHHNGSDLSGIVRPVRSFRDGRGRVCRHLHVTLSSGSRQKSTESIACRTAGGPWHLDG
jgi:hypothetical protein